MKNRATQAVYAIIFIFTSVASVQAHLFNFIPLDAHDPALQQAIGLDAPALQHIINSLNSIEERNVSAWQGQYYFMPEIINRFNLKVGAEIGVAFGTHSQHMLERTNLEKLYSIDCYKNFAGSPAELAGLGSMNMAQEYMDVLHYRVALRLTPYGTRSELMRMTSMDAVQQIPDEALDFVYIDGDHSYNAVCNDLEAWWQKTRAGGIFAGDDYAQPNHPGVKRAVDEFMQKQGLKINRAHPYTWWVQKPMKTRLTNTQSKHFVSFIVPCYNRAHTIREAIDSIYQQELLEDFEVVCVDDASTDNSVEILQEYAAKHPNFSFYVHPVNQGASAARNTAITHAHGDLLFTLDSDNKLEPNSVHHLVKLLDETGCDIAAFQEARFFKDVDSFCYSCWCTPEKNAPPRLLYLWDLMPTKINPILENYLNAIMLGNYLFTRESWLEAGKYEGRALETFCFGFRQLAHGSSIAILPSHYYWHRLSDDSKWNQNQYNGTNPTTALNLIKNNQILFNTQTVNRLAHYHAKERDILHDIHSGFFILLPREALELLFKAQRAEKTGNFVAAITYYQEIMKYRESSRKIRIRFNQLRKLVQT